MKDFQASLEKLREIQAEYALIRDLAMDQTKREMFDGCLSILTGLPMRLSGRWLKRQAGKIQTE